MQASAVSVSIAQIGNIWGALWKDGESLGDWCNVAFPSRKGTKKMGCIASHILSH